MTDTTKDVVMNTGIASMTDIVCPFCAMACDDLSVEWGMTGRLTVTANGCGRARSLFALPSLAVPCYRRNQPVSLDEALDTAAALLRQAVKPVIGGLAADTEGVSAALALAERLGAVVDHAASDSLFHGVRALPVAGAMTTTYNEVRNRADLLVLFGADFDRHTPRLFDRLVYPGQALFQAAAGRRVIVIGPGGDSLPDGVERLEAELSHTPAVAAALAQMVIGSRPRGESIGGIAMAALEQVATALTSARFGVIGWVSSALDAAFGDLAIEALNRLVVAVNATTRCAGLSISGSGNALGANHVAARQYGVPLRSRLGAGPPEHDPLRYRAKSLLASGDADALLWVAALNGAGVPDTEAPLIVLARPGQPLPRDPDVLIPVATPGLDHAGTIHRGDGVAALPLRRLRPTLLPSAADVLTALHDRIASSAPEVAHV